MTHESIDWLHKQEERRQRQMDILMLEDAYVSWLMLQALGESDLRKWHEDRFNHIVNIFKQQGVIYDANES